MIARFLIAATLAATLAAPAVAQQHRRGAPQQAARTEAGAVDANRLVGAAVRTKAGQILGRVDGVTTGPDGRVTGAVVNIGGDLQGTMKNHITVDVDRLSPAPNDRNAVVADLTMADLEASPGWQGGERQGWVRPGAVEQMGSAPEPMTGASRPMGSAPQPMR